MGLSCLAVRLALVSHLFMEMGMPSQEGPEGQEGRVV